MEHMTSRNENKTTAKKARDRPKIRKGSRESASSSWKNKMSKKIVHVHRTVKW